jgi:cytochrome bd-type quinol oxidase subunit 2
MDGLRNKWRWMVTLAWIVAAASVIASVWLGFQFGTYQAVELNSQFQNETVTKLNMPVIMGCTVQAMASILFGVMFTVLNEIYESTIDIYMQNQRAIRSDR